MISPFDDAIVSTVNSLGAPAGFTLQQFAALINSVIQKESAFKPDAVSYTGAGIGLMQVNPQIWLSVYNITRENLFDPVTNIAVGSKILLDYLNRYGLKGGLGAYFAGPAGRLSQGAVNYANVVLSYYNNFITRVKELFTVKQPGQELWWFVDPTQNLLDTAPDYPALPEYTYTADLQIDSNQPIFTTSGTDTYGYEWLWLALIAGGLFLLVSRDL